MRRSQGTFDALFLMTAGYPRVVAIFIGVHGWRWEWARGVREIVLAMDADLAGLQEWRELAGTRGCLGEAICLPTPGGLRRHKDVSEAWVAGVLRVGD